MTKLARKGFGGPSFCWECHRQLQRAPGQGMGRYYFELVRDPGGVQHRVHQGCVRESVANGNKFVSERA